MPNPELVSLEEAIRQVEESLSALKLRLDEQSDFSRLIKKMEQSLELSRIEMVEHGKRISRLEEWWASVERHGWRRL